MLVRLQGSNIEVTYKRGSQLYIADTLLGAPLKQGQNKVSPKEIVFYDELEAVHQAGGKMVKETKQDRTHANYEEDEEAKEFKKGVIMEERLNTLSETAIYFHHRDELTLEDGVVYKGSNVIAKPLPAET